MLELRSERLPASHRADRVGDVVVGQAAALAILEPLLADLVAADMETPHGFGHAAKAHCSGGIRILLAAGVNPDGAAVVLRPTDLGDFPGFADGRGDGLIEDGRFQQM